MHVKRHKYGFLPTVKIDARMTPDTTAHNLSKPDTNKSSAQQALLTAIFLQNFLEKLWRRSERL